MKRTERTGKYISYLSRRILKYTSENFKDHGLASIEYAYVMILRDGVTKTQEELTKEVMVDKSQTTRAIKSLLDKGLVTKEKDELDKRAFHISLTKKGEEMVPIIEEEINDFETTLNKGISIEEQRIVIKSLIKMIRNLKEAGE